jgi:hypothetical protein
VTGVVYVSAMTGVVPAMLTMTVVAMHVIMMSVGVGMRLMIGMVILVLMILNSIMVCVFHLDSPPSAIVFVSLSKISEFSKR